MFALATNVEIWHDSGNVKMPLSSVHQYQNQTFHINLQVTISILRLIFLKLNDSLQHRRRNRTLPRQLL